MLNQTVIVGRLVRDPELLLTDSGKKVTNITLAVPRSFKNLNGVYDTDYIDCALWAGIAECTTEYAKKGDLLGVKGRIQTQLIDNSDGTKRKVTDVIAEKVTFLSTKKNDDENETEEAKENKNNKKNKE